MAALSTFRDVVSDRTAKVQAKEPIDASEHFIKYEQPWPINENKEKGEAKPKDSSPDGRGLESALQQINTKKVFESDKYISVPLVKRKDLNDDTRIYTFKHPFESVKALNLGIGQHFQCGFVLKDGTIVERPYAIVRPTGADKEDGTIDILVKTAFPTEKHPGGTISNVLDCLKADRGDEMLIRGPEGPISYQGNGKFSISLRGEERKAVSANKVNFISGGTGMTPIYATIRAILETDSDSEVEVRFMDANVNEKEILLKDKLDHLAQAYTRFEVVHVIEKPGASWQGQTGLIDKEKMEKGLFPAEKGTISLVCGPPPMMKAAKEGLLELGFEDEKTFFHY